jgi:hypothetical protein
MKDRDRRRQQWGEVLEELGFSITREASSFLQFNPPPDAKLAMDLMFVSDNVFEQMQAAAFDAALEGIQFRVVSLMH